MSRTFNAAVSVVGIDIGSAIGTEKTSPASLAMSIDGGGPEVTGKAPSPFAHLRLRW